MDCVLLHLDRIASCLGLDKLCGINRRSCLHHMQDKSRFPRMRSLSEHIWLIVCVRPQCFACGEAWYTAPNAGCWPS